jgi:3-hydroxyacyl-CoA dehydrogenase
MEVKVGVKGVARELLVETDLTPDEVAALVQECAGETTGVLELTDVRGRRVLIPAEKLAYVEIGEQETRRVGFGAM